MIPPINTNECYGFNHGFQLVRNHVFGHLQYFHLSHVVFLQGPAPTFQGS